jgi:site-specific recombinase XerD
MSHRFKRLADSLGVDAHLHTLRHYAATELLTAGVDLRTVAGRLGHGDGSVTLRHYAALVNHADQRRIYPQHTAHEWCDDIVELSPWPPWGLARLQSSRPRHRH